MNKLRRIIERYLNIQMGTLEKPDGTITDPESDTLQHLASTHFGKASNLKQTTYTKDIIMKPDINDWNPDLLSVGKIAIAISEQKITRA